MTSAPLPGRDELAPRARVALLALGYAIYVACGPGWLWDEGSPLGALGLVPWALAASRPGRGKARLEWLCGAAAFTAQTWWMGYVFAPVLPAVAAGWGLWALYPGMLLKRLARRLPLALAVPLAWSGFEALLAWTKPPLGLSWLRLGHYLCDWPELAGSARVWGDLGLGFCLAACTGLLADALVARRTRTPLARASLVGAALPLALAAAFGLVWRAPATEPGPRVLLVQPAFEQQRKQVTGEPEELFAESLALTTRGLAENRAAGGAEPDLVVWGESMLYATVVEDGLDDVVAGLEVDPWSFWSDLDGPTRASYVRALRAQEQRRLARLVGDPRRRETGALPAGTSFAVGVDGLVAHAGRLAGTVAFALWSPRGERVGVSGKVHLAPGGETMVGLERFDVVRQVIYDLADYVPDRLAAERTDALPLEGRDGRRWTFGASVCFDNAFDDPYAGPLRRGDVDFHLVVSNEAWYERTQELDQMVAFSRTLALATGRALVRCANSGVSAAFGADGRELGRVRVDGDDRMVAGTLCLDVPVPTAAARATRTPFVLLQPGLRPLFALLPWLALAIGRRSARYRAASGE
ncbi:MAG: apolipoprotein N-acyltransferase [Planctomycetes bacterium]|nr:apolipoprotein N-acyltransferase [Planctomycetota bacterium]